MNINKWKYENNQKLYRSNDHENYWDGIIFLVILANIIGGHNFGSDFGQFQADIWISCPKTDASCETTAIFFTRNSNICSKSMKNTKKNGPKMDFFDQKMT